MLIKEEGSDEGPVGDWENDVSVLDSLDADEAVDDSSLEVLVVGSVDANI